MNGVIYARYSSSGQREESIADQLRVCTDFAKREGINVVGEYCDFAKTGTNDRQAEFQRMLADSGKPKTWEVVLVYRLEWGSPPRVRGIH